jgi:hypothetical protein
MNILGILVILGVIVILAAIMKFAVRLGCLFLTLGLIALTVYLLASGKIGMFF